MKKKDLKKLALMGITGGVMMASQGTVEASNSSPVTNILAAKCGSSGSCGGATAAKCGSSGSCGGATASRCGGYSGQNYYQDPSGYQETQWSNDVRGQSGSDFGGAPNQYHRNPPQESYSPQQRNQNYQANQNADTQRNPNANTQRNPNANTQGNQNPNYKGNSQGSTSYQQHSCGSPSGRTVGNTSYQQHSCGSPSNNSWGNTSHSCGASKNARNAVVADNDDDDASADSDQGQAKRPLTEDEFKAKLSTQGKADFDKLSPAGKALAIKIASHDCAGKNDCKGQNACKTDKNSCAGQGGCKGQSKCKATPDQAVKAASLKDKRTSLTNSSSNRNNNR